MKYILKFPLLILILCLAVGLGLTSLKSPTQSESRIKIVNKSSWAIDHIYFSPVDKNTWGKDILAKDEVLEPNESIMVLVDCDIWDVKFIAIDGAVCIVEDVDICEVEGVWTIDDMGCE
jgi:hypothetical protein